MIDLAIADFEKNFSTHQEAVQLVALVSQTLKLSALIAWDIVGQCACDLRNPQGSCCLGNVRGLIKRVDALDAEMAK